MFSGLLKGVGTRPKQRGSRRPGRQPDGILLLQSGALAHVEKVPQVRVVDFRGVGHDFRRVDEHAKILLMFCDGAVCLSAGRVDITTNTTQRVHRLSTRVETAAAQQHVTVQLLSALREAWCEAQASQY